MQRPVWESLSSKEIEVDRLIEKLALESCKDTLIGDGFEQKHLRRSSRFRRQTPWSTGLPQAKRVNIGIALITDPRVLFLDEPTSGLDSYTSNEVMTVVKSLVDDGTTICATIHSPTPLAFSLFDRVILLLRGNLVFRKEGYFSIHQLQRWTLL